MTKNARSVDTVERERERERDYTLEKQSMVLFNSLTHTQYNLKNSKNENILTDVHILLAKVGII